MYVIVRWQFWPADESNVIVRLQFWPADKSNVIVWPERAVRRSKTVVWDELNDGDQSQWFLRQVDIEARNIIWRCRVLFSRWHVQKTLINLSSSMPVGGINRDSFQKRIRTRDQSETSMRVSCCVLSISAKLVSDMLQNFAAVIFTLKSLHGPFVMCSWNRCIEDVAADRYESADINILILSELRGRKGKPEVQNWKLNCRNCAQWRTLSKFDMKPEMGRSIWW